MIGSRLDECCENIFTYITRSHHAFRFEELQQDLNEEGFKITKFDLLTHLDHLHKHRLVTRKREGKQNDFYQVNWSKINCLRRHVNHRQYLERSQKEKEMFNSSSIEERIKCVSEMMQLPELTRLRSLIVSILEPNGSFEAASFLFVRNYLSASRTWLLLTCVSSKENAQEALKSVEQQMLRIS